MSKSIKNIDLNPIRHTIISLHKKSLTNVEITKQLAHLKVNKMLVSRTVSRFLETGDAIPAKKPGKKRSKRTPQVINMIRERIRRYPARSGRKMAREMNMGKSTLQNLLKVDLGLRAFKKQKVAGLTVKNKEERVKRCKRLLKRHDGPDIIFSDEKLFVLEAPLNKQNDRVYGVSLQDLPEGATEVFRYQNASAVMVYHGTWSCIKERQI